MTTAAPCLICQHYDRPMGSRGICEWCYDGCDPTTWRIVVLLDEERKRLAVAEDSIAKFQQIVLDQETQIVELELGPSR